METSLNPDYKDLLQTIKERIRHSQIKAMVQVNQTLLLLYREIGKMILERQENESRGKKIVEKLAKDLKKEFPNMKGFSKRNFHFMRQFAKTYSNFEIVKQVVSQISRGHNIRLLQKCETNKERLRYAQKALEHGWSRSILVHHIEVKRYERE